MDVGPLLHQIATWISLPFDYLAAQKFNFFFNTLDYLVFFLAIFTLYWAMPWHRARVWLLVAASFVFYAAWSRELAFLVLSTTVMDYLLARGMDATNRRWLRRLLLLTSLFVNLGLLCYFKYKNFFLDSLNDVFGGAKNVGLGSVFGGAAFGVPEVAHGGFALESLNGFLASWGVGANVVLRDLIIPFGISFYTFEAISYSVDVYLRRIKAERSLPNFMLFILFFPHLVSGPIVRGRDFLPQASRPKRFDWLRIQLGVQFFLMGLFKKMAIADRMAVFSDPVFQHPELYNTGAIWLAVLAYAVRIYCDFSGYSDMALGSAHMLGYKLTLNFRMPYLSANVAEFWRRWHISLSSWLRDYLFIPLGGSRCSRAKTCRNLMITMLLGGLWHGANWSYVIWGGLHGSFLVVHRYFRDFCKGRPGLDAVLQSAPGTGLRVLTTFLCVALCWVFFQPSLTIAGTMLGRMFTLQSGRGLDLHNRSLWYTVVFVLICHLIVTKGLWRRWATRMPAPVLGFGYAVTLTVALLLAPDAGKAFIYFTF